MKLNEAWNADDATRLQQLRVEAGWELPDLARRACLSVAQVTQLEQGGDSHFYTPAIKQLAGTRAVGALERWSQAQRRTAKRPVGAEAGAPSQVRPEVASTALHTPLTGTP